MREEIGLTSELEEKSTGNGLFQFSRNLALREVIGTLHGFELYESEVEIRSRNVIIWEFFHGGILVTICMADREAIF